MDTQEKEIITAAVDALTGKMLYRFTVKNREPVIPKRTLLDRLLRKPIVEPVLKRTFDIYPTVVACQYGIAAKALSLPENLFEEQSKMLAYVPEHLPTMIQIIAATITNSRGEPSAELVTYLEDNIDNEDIMHILAASLQQANMQDFMTSIALMNGMAEILEPSKVSPLDGRELIASHTPESPVL